MGEFVRVLRNSRTVIISLQLLQTVSIMIQNLKSEHFICKIFLLIFVACIFIYKKILMLMCYIFSSLKLLCRLYVQ